MLGHELVHGTVVVIDKLDRLNWVTSRTLEDKLLEHFGITYRNYVRRTNLLVNGTKVQPIDPLFTDPNARYYDDNELRAEELDPIIVEVREKDEKGNRKEVIGTVSARFAYLPPGFQNKDAKVGKGTAELPGRFNIMKDNQGILVLRAGRQIDVVTSRCPLVGNWNNYDRNWKVELDFTPTLDDEFSITTSKQQVVLSERMWTILEQAGLRRVITAMRQRFQLDLKAMQGAQEEPGDGGMRTSEEVMTKAAKFRPQGPAPAPGKQEERDNLLLEEVATRSRTSGKPKEQVERELLAELINSPYRILFESLPGAPFYRPEAIGSQVRVYINKAHQFYTDVYMGIDSTPRMRASLELMLFVMTDCELDANVERQVFYESERHEWTRRFAAALRLLEQRDPSSDAASVKAESEEQETAIP
jgi:hypothetical protein